MMPPRKASLMLAACFATLVASAGGAGFAQSAVAATRGGALVVRSGEVLTLAASRKVSSLRIEPDGAIKAVDGKSLTLVVDGAQRDLAPGTYSGDVELVVTDSVIVPYTGVGDYDFRSAVFVSDGRVEPSRSVLGSVRNAAFAAGSLKGGVVRSEGAQFNGIYVTGKDAFAIDGVDIALTGNGTNDFVGYAAAIAATDETQVTIAHADIRTRGAVRTALFVGGKSKVNLRDSYIAVSNGTLPDDYTFSIIPGQMMEAPYGLGLTGNVRAVNLVDTGTLQVTNSVIRAQGWGALSTDGAGPTRMFVVDSLIEARESGYGAYANGDAIDTFDHSTIHAADYALIIGGNGSGRFLNGTAAVSDRIGVMMHQGTGGSTLEISGKSTLASRTTAIQIKGRGAKVLVDDARVSAGNGILIQTMENDDPIMKAMAAGGPGSPMIPPGGMEQMNPGGGADAPPPPPPPPGGAPISTEVFSPDVEAILRATTLYGNVYHAMPKVGAMRLSLQGARLTGVISTSTAAPASGKAPTKETWREIGEVGNTPVPFTGAKGLSLQIDGASTWTVTGTSYLNAMTLAPGAQVVTPAGEPATLLVNGKATALKPGTYQGALVVSVGSVKPLAPRAPGALDMAEFVASVDTNADGKMSRAEWAAAKLPFISFDGFEKGRGYVTADDYQNKPAPPGIDLNGDGKLSIAEFLAFDEKMKNAPPPSAPPAN